MRAKILRKCVDVEASQHLEEAMIDANSLNVPLSAVSLI